MRRLRGLRARGGGIYLAIPVQGSFAWPAPRLLTQTFVDQVAPREAHSEQVRLAREGRPVYLEGPERLVQKGWEILLGEGLRVLAMVPIVGSDRVLGCLNLASRQGDRIPRYSRYALEIVAGQIGIFLARFLAQQSLQASKDSYCALFAHIHNGIVLQAAVRNQDGQVCGVRNLDCNPAFERQTGQRATEILGRELLDTFPDTWMQEEALADYRRVIDQGEIVQVERFLPHLGRRLGVTLVPAVCDRVILGSSRM
jgi:PAS domain-containing protein